MMRKPGKYLFIGMILATLLFMAGCTPTADLPEEQAQPPSGDTSDASEDIEAQEQDAPEITEEPAAPVDESPSVEEQVATLEGQPIDAFFDSSFDLILMRSPQWITELGLGERYGIRNDQLDDLSEAFILETYDLKQAILDALLAYDYDSLTPEQQVSYDVYQWWLELELEGEQFMYHDYFVHHFLIGYPDNLIRFFTETHPLETREDVEDYIARLAASGTQVSQVAAGVETRREMGLIPPDFIIEMTRGRIASDLNMRSSDVSAINPEGISLYTVFRERLENVEGLTDEERQAFLDAARLEIEQSFIPAYAGLWQAVRSLDELATSDAGVWHLPDGDAYYAYLLKEQTSTDLTPEEIHAIGLAEVERITEEFHVAFADLGYPEGESLETGINRAINEAGYVYGAQEIIDAYYALIDGVEAVLPAVFDVQPEAALIVVGEPYGGGGFYMSASLDGSRPGAFHAGTGGRAPKYFMPTLTYHEGIPGHHFQIAISQEMDLPLFRNVIQYNGYAEGWALYAERLAWELGLYEDDPYGNIGRLQLELLRAVRLVADTGMHDMGWTRGETRAYMREAMGGDSWTHEVERYVVLPAQATGYKIGMIKMLELRSRAEEALGDAFDLTAFHNVILTNGSMPLEVLDRVIDDWIAAQLP